MKKYISVLALISRATFYKIILILLAMVTIEIGLFYVTLGTPDSLGTLEEELDSSRIAWICVAASIAVAVILEGFGKNRSGSYPAYTISRLSIKENHFTLLCGIYNTCCFTILMGVQILTALILCLLYVQRNTADPYSPAMFLAFCRSGFLHGLLPLGETWGLIRNILLLAGFGLACSTSSLMHRRGERYPTFGFLFGYVMTLLPMTSNKGVIEYLYIIIIVILFAYSFYRIWKGGGPDEDDEPEMEG